MFVNIWVDIRAEDFLYLHTLVYSKCNLKKICVYTIYAIVQEYCAKLLDGLASIL